MSNYYTEEERKKEWTFECDNFTFKTCRDLSCGITVTPRNPNLNYPIRELMNMLAQEISQFTFYWSFYHRGNLNGFSGLDTIIWNVNYKLSHE